MMPRYLIEGSYTHDGTKGLLQEGGTSRRDTVTKMIEGMGGSVESFYYMFGDRDVIVIVSVPDESTALALSMAVNQSGKVRLTTHQLLSVEDVDRAAKKTVSYRSPGA
ncbi:MAG TPA: GYD domain-containing protein [Gemmatimonadaceae bacterium]|nr:GYD domain-containing protein [Gemmatimonadaceae bacterium]